MILDELCEHASRVAAAHWAADVRLGLGYTGVLLEDQRCGLAYTFRHETGYGCTAFREAGSLQGRPAAELLAMGRPSEVLGAAVALATVNALCPPPADAAQDGLDLMGLQPSDTVGMVGYFGPLVETLQKRCRTLHIFEKTPNRNPAVLPAEKAAEVLPQCQAVILTATTLLNGTLDELLQHCRGAREILLLGPSTPYAPQVLAPRGITVLAGVRVVDATRTLQTISEGGGTMKFSPFTKKFGVRIR
ncbi:MAG: DUF364 domain-containing protein [Acidobacteriota bacterium]|nr:DUF364 domain-containing protein [Acidobacteriota bacterium]